MVWKVVVFSGVRTAMPVDECVRSHGKTPISCSTKVKTFNMSIIGLATVFESVMQDILEMRSVPGLEMKSENVLRKWACPEDRCGVHSTFGQARFVNHAF